MYRSIVMEQPNEKKLKSSSEIFYVNDVAGFFGFTPRVLKHYETTGVLQPARADNNGYREYSAEDVIKIQTAKQLKHANLSNREIGEFFSGELDVEKKRDELLKIRASIDRIIDLFDLELSDGEPQFDFAEETSLFCYCNAYPLGGDVIRRYVEARETYSQAIKSGFQCDFEHTFFYCYDNLFPLPDFDESDENQLDKLLPDSVTDSGKKYRVCVPVIAPDKRDKKPCHLPGETAVVTRKKSFVLKYSGKAYGAGKMYYRLQEEAKKRNLALNGNVWSFSLTGPNRKTRNRSYTLFIGAELE